MKYLLGPELLWLLIYLGVSLMARFNVPPTEGMNDALVRLAWWLPLIAIPLTFGLYWLPGVEHRWLLLRIWVVCLFGTHYALDKGLSAHGEGGPGVGTAYMMGLALALPVLVVGSIVVKIRF